MIQQTNIRVAQNTPALEEIDLQAWYAFMADQWAQGEHVCIVGPTGSGKTTVAHTLLDLRGYVVVLAVKRTDETLERFKAGEKYGRKKYTVIKAWPPRYPLHHVVLWVKPKELGVTNDQKERLQHAVNKIYLAGGWTIFWDDGGYITGYLGMAGKLGIMLNQGRSDHLTNVVAITQPKSMVARLPSETFKQCRHQLVFLFDNEDEIKAIGAIIGIPHRKLLAMMAQLGKHDFLYKGKGRIFLVRNTLPS